MPRSRLGFKTGGQSGGRYLARFFDEAVFLAFSYLPSLNVLKYSLKVRRVFPYFRRQTAEEREQERQAATKYFLSMQLGSLGSSSSSSSSSSAPPSSATSSSAVSSQQGIADSIPKDIAKLVKIVSKTVLHVLVSIPSKTCT